MSTTSINLRLDPDTAEKFKNLCQENGITQADGFEAALKALELSNAEDAVPDEKATIGSIRMNLDSVMNGVLTLLQHLNEANKKAKDDVQAELNAKDQTIEDMKKFRADKDREIDSLHQSNKDLRQKAKEARQAQEVAEAKLKAAQSEAEAQYKEQISKLQEQVRLLDQFNLIAEKTPSADSLHEETPNTASNDTNS